LEEAQAEHPSQAERHVGIRGEVEIDLQAVKQDAPPGHDRSDRGDGLRENRVDGGGHRVRDEHLLPEPEHEAADTYSKIRPGRPMGPQLVRDVVVADDRAGDELGEHRNVECEVDDLALGGDLPAVDVDEVGERVEGEKGDADREVNRAEVHSRGTRRSDEKVQVRDDESRVLEEGEQPQVSGHRQGQHAAATPDCFPQPQAEPIVHGDRQQDHPGPLHLPPGVEDQARHGQKSVLGPAAYQERTRQHEGQEQEQEDRRAEDHDAHLGAGVPPDLARAAPAEAQMNTSIKGCAALK